MRFWKFVLRVSPKDLSGVKQRSFGFAIIMFAMVINTVGCTGDSVQGKASLHEMDHVVAAHWPESLEDAADKIRERVTRLGGGSAVARGIDSVVDAKKELSEILSWVPEVAADTDMSEANWVPLAEESERLHARLKMENFSDQLGKQVLDFADVLATAWNTGDSDDA